MRQQRLTQAERKHQTRERLLDAAMEVFSQRGFHPASLDDVADAAGFTKGAIYAHFANKEALFLAVFDRQLARETRQWESIATYGPGGSEAVPEGRFVQLLSENRSWTLLIIEFVLYAMREEGVRPLLAQRLHDLRSVMQKHLAQLFTDQSHEPSLPREYVPWGIFALGAGLSMQAYLDPEALPPDLYERMLAHLLT